MSYKNIEHHKPQQSLKTRGIYPRLMPNMLSQMENLVLEGYFRISKRSNQEEREGIDINEISEEAKEILKFKAEDFDFKVNILDLNLDSGLFIAKGDDIEGKSVIYGQFKGAFYTPFIY